MKAAVLNVGLDWGTHSSKWWYSVSSDQHDLNGEETQGPKILARVIDSTVHRKGDALFLFHERSYGPAEIRDSHLKRLLLSDPMGANYWHAVREGLGISLGEAAALILCTMLSDMYSCLVAEGVELADSTKIKFRYSLPNWTDSTPDHVVARKRMFQTTVVATCLLRQHGWGSLPKVGEPVSLQGWRDRIREAQQDTEATRLMAASPGSFAELVEQEYSIAGYSWRLAAESSAAGFMPLNHLLRNVSPRSMAQKHWVKLLVVDVGAGSTDAGYFISSRNVNDKHLIFNYLPPALTLDYAGEKLTEMLREHVRRTKRRDISRAEAETMKVSAPEEWINEDFAVDWRKRIAKSVAEYIFRVPDQSRLSEAGIPGLKIVVTGGSGVVEGLDTTIRAEVYEALFNRPEVPQAVAGRTEVIPLVSPINDPVDAARRAVSTGAAHPSFADLKYTERMEGGEPVIYRVQNRWV